MDIIALSKKLNDLVTAGKRNLRKKGGQKWATVSSFLLTAANQMLFCMIKF